MKCYPCGNKRLCGLADYGSPLSKLLTNYERKICSDQGLFADNSFYLGIGDKMNFSRFAFVTLLGLGSASLANAITVNFDDQGFSGTSLFATTVTDSPTISTADGDVMLDGGGFLTNTANLPANQTTVYGTASFFQGGLNPITLSFENPVNNFTLDILNGDISPATYMLSDDIGNSSTFTIAPNLSGGKSTVGFAATGNTISITAVVTGGGDVANVIDPSDNRFFDFFIDNVTFNAPIPTDIITPDEVVVVNPNPTTPTTPTAPSAPTAPANPGNAPHVIPVPASMVFLASGLIALLGFGRRKTTVA